ncbi:hypothetical protein CEUSTIGMA_g9277.t1 [Chlamydomonas eustigma]|uniref:Uncharacterized protein n=1 Tax=Chlamydomonas eustigma TaxID=1157962 RepID=A0A250XG13_9CHLO|nr:hypothetical protein CEUSTIGMA_g9277.t1 [Chlamydomonas eustigma]|eukprot:GAX81849.1 hypothetical protein CEUSTIGMA_g9277.t1 [Chlamydomonas eustigma]
MRHAHHSSAHHAGDCSTSSPSFAHVRNPCSWSSWKTRSQLLNPKNPDPMNAIIQTGVLRSDYCVHSRRQSPLCRAAAAVVAVSPPSSEFADANDCRNISDEMLLRLPSVPSMRETLKNPPHSVLSELTFEPLDADTFRNWPPLSTDSDSPDSSATVPEDIPQTREQAAGVGSGQSLRVHLSPEERAAGVGSGQSLRVHLSPEERAMLQQALSGSVMDTFDVEEVTPSHKALEVAAESVNRKSSSSLTTAPTPKAVSRKLEAAAHCSVSTTVSVTVPASQTAVPASQTAVPVTQTAVPVTQIAVPAADKNSDRIKALVHRFLKVPVDDTSVKAGTSTTSTTPTSTTSTVNSSTLRLKAGEGKAAAAKRSLAPQQDAAAPASRIRSALNKVTARKGSSATASSSISLVRTFLGSTSVSCDDSDVSASHDVRRVASSVRNSSSSLSTSEVASDVGAVLRKYVLPEDVADAVAAAVIAKQLPSKPASLDALLARLLMPSSGLKPELVHAVLKRSPAALKQSSERLHSKLRSLEHALDCSEDELLGMLGSTRNLLGLKAETIKGKLGSLSGIMCLPPARISALARKCPHLLSCSTETLSSKFKGIKQLVQRPHEQVVQMVLETPQLLFLNPQSLQTKFEDLCEVMEASPSRMGEMVLARPMLLTSSTQTIKDRWFALRSVVSSSTRWRAELKSLAPATLASILLASKSKVRRLSYLAAQDLQETAALSSLINMTQPEFVKKYPGFKIWSLL